MRFLILFLCLTSAAFAQKNIQPRVAATNSLASGGGGGSTTNGITTTPYLWLKADDNSAGAITTWSDASGNALDGGQATAGKKPTAIANALNGHSTVYFDGGDCITNPAITLTSYTIFVVTSNSANGIIMEHSANAGLGNGTYIYSDQTSSFANYRTTESSKNIGANWGLGKWMVVDAHYTGTHTATSILTNNVDTAVDSTGTANPGAGSLTDVLNIGSRANAGGLPLTGHISELIIYKPALGASDRNTVRAFLNTRYGNIY